MELDKFKTKDVVVAPKPQKQEHRFLGTMIRRPGLTLFEYDSKSKIVRAAEVNTQHFYSYNAKRNTFGFSTKSRVQTRDGCMYFQALNLKTLFVRCVKRGL